MKRKFLIRGNSTLEHETRPVEGELISFEGFEGITFFIHNPIEAWIPTGNRRFNFHISEASTGFLVGRGDTEEEATKDAEYVLSCHGYETTKKRIALMVEKHGCLLDGVEHKERP